MEQGLAAHFVPQEYNGLEDLPLENVSILDYINPGARAVPAVRSILTPDELKVAKKQAAKSKELDKARQAKTKAKDEADFEDRLVDEMYNWRPYEGVNPRENIQDYIKHTNLLREQSGLARKAANSASEKEKSLLAKGYKAEDVGSPMRDGYYYQILENPGRYNGLKTPVSKQIIKNPTEWLKYFNEGLK